MMAHSYKHTPIYKSDGQKEEKQLANRAFRRLTRIKIVAHRYDELPHHVRCVSDVWCWPSDGCRWFLFDDELTGWANFFKNVSKMTNYRKIVNYSMSFLKENITYGN